MAWLALPLTIGVFLVGIWVAGGVITDSFRASMALVALWYAVAAGAVYLVARRRGPVAIPVVIGYLVAAAGVGGYLALSTFNDKVVNEQVAVGVPAASASSDAVPVQEATGEFASGEHTTTGAAAVVRLPDGRRVLTLTDFETSAGPDLRVRIVPGRTEDGGADGNIDLGGLKGNRGNQQYGLPAGFEPGNHTVVIWCRAFSASFGNAPLT